MDFKPLPIGYENFSNIISEEYYFVDKSLIIRDILDKKAKVNLFTRPRRFGKTLTLSMLKYFFEDAHDFQGNKTDNTHLFDGLKIMDAGEKYIKHMGQYPVISLTLKSGKQNDLYDSLDMIYYEISKEFHRHRYILESEMLDDRIKKKFISFMNEEFEENSEADYEIRKRTKKNEYKKSLWFLSSCLKIATGKDVIILIDEYDVPLESSWSNGYYNEMVDFIRSLFETALKTNDNLYFAVVTGCLRISKESIFTGLNNLDINSVLSNNFEEYFGFTDDEVKKICDDYDLSDKYEEAKDWYNGYYFGDANIYNPWSTILYIRDHVNKRDAFPVSYWANSSSNSIVRTLIDRADRETKDTIENLIAGGSIEKPIHEDITYAEIEDDIDNLWNFMFFTGYFKKVSERFEGEQLYVTMEIPNREVKYIFNNKIRKWFNELVEKTDRHDLFDAIVSKDTATMEEIITTMLYETISYFDTVESFYHGFLAGILYGMKYYRVKSNRESGNGRTDLFMIPSSRRKTAYIFEFKIAKNSREFEIKADEAIAQINNKKYDTELITDGYKDIVKYGICFFDKDCAVVVE